jgi:hypothetical protein
LSRCITTEAAHHERHVVIAKLVHDVKSCDNASQETAVRKRRKGRARDSSDEAITHDYAEATDVSSDHTSFNEDCDANFEADEMFQSPCERRPLKRTMKDKKNQEKAFKNQQRFVISVSQAHVDLVAKVVHSTQYNGDKIGGHPQAQENEIDTIFERNDTFNGAIKEHRLWLKEQVRDSRARSGKKGVDARKRQQNEDAQNGLPVQKQDMDELVSAILEQLGVSDRKDTLSSTTRMGFPTPARSKKHKAGMLVQIRKEIAADIEKSANESRARQQRMEGYWRYVSGTVTNRLADNARSVDRATGAKLKGHDDRQRLAKMLHMDQAEDPEIEADPDHFEELQETDQPLKNL